MYENFIILNMKVKTCFKEFFDDFSCFLGQKILLICEFLLAGEICIVVKKIRFA